MQNSREVFGAFRSRTPTSTAVAQAHAARLYHVVAPQGSIEYLYTLQRCKPTPVCYCPTLPRQSAHHACLYALQAHACQHTQPHHDVSQHTMCACARFRLKPASIPGLFFRYGKTMISLL
eukprot:1150577-Pelagomonas_calceolata.AAC.1